MISSSRAARWAVVAVLLGCQSGDLTPRPPIAPDAASYVIWGRAIDFESSGTREFEQVSSQFDLFYGQTLILPWPEVETEARIRRWKEEMPDLRDDTVEAFILGTRASSDIDAHRLVTAFPARPARPEEMSWYYLLTDKAEPAASGLFCVSEVGYAGDRSQALVLVQSARAGVDAPFGLLLLFRAEPAGWKVSDYVMQPSIPAEFLPH